MKFEFTIGTQLIVVLKKTCYIELWRGTREVDVMSLETTKRKLDCPDGLSMEKLKEGNIVAIKCILGRYVGSRNENNEGKPNKLKIIKIDPSFGLMHPDSEYLIIYPDYIESINKYQLIPNE
jgi:hypothetical protein